MGPIKINIKSNTSEYGGDCDQVPDVPDRVKETGDQSVVEPKCDLMVTGENKERDNIYEYEGEDCFYTEPSSGVRYKWCKEASAWVNTLTGESRGSGDSSVAEEAAGQNYKMEDGTYVYVDRLTNKKHKWNLETKEWDVVENTEEPEEEEESEEDESMSEAERKAKQYRKRKAAPGWDEANYQKVSTSIVILHLVSYFCFIRIIFLQVFTDESTILLADIFMSQTDIEINIQCLLFAGPRHWCDDLQRSK